MTVSIDRAFLEELVALLKEHEEMEPVSLRIQACSMQRKVLPPRAQLLRETIRVRQNLEDQLADATPLQRPTPGRLSVG